MGIDGDMSRASCSPQDHSHDHDHHLQIGIGSRLEWAELLLPDSKESLPGATWSLDRGEIQPPGGSTDSGRAFLGCLVRLRPGPWRTDARDLLWAGQIARVEKIETDIDDHCVLAVTLCDDSATDAHRSYGRVHRYYLDEVELVAYTTDLDSPVETGRADHVWDA